MPPIARPAGDSSPSSPAPLPTPPTAPPLPTSGPLAPLTFRCGQAVHVVPVGRVARLGSVPGPKGTFVRLRGGEELPCSEPLADLHARYLAAAGLAGPLLTDFVNDEPNGSMPAAPPDR